MNLFCFIVSLSQWSVLVWWSHSVSIYSRYRLMKNRIFSVITADARDCNSLVYLLTSLWRHPTTPTPTSSSSFSSSSYLIDHNVNFFAFSQVSIVFFSSFRSWILFLFTFRTTTCLENQLRKMVTNFPTTAFSEIVEQLLYFQYLLCRQNIGWKLIN